MVGYKVLFWVFTSPTELDILIMVSFSPQIRVSLPVGIGYSFPIQNVLPFCSKRVIRYIEQVILRLIDILSLQSAMSPS